MFIGLHIPPVKNVLYVWNRAPLVVRARKKPNVGISKHLPHIDKIDYLCYYLFMPAKKPLTMIEKHLTKEERESRLLRESALEPITQLSADVPFPLQGKSNKHAAQVWSRSIQLYSELKGKVATSLDQNLLIKYCKADQQFLELENLRSEKISQWEESKAKAKRVKLTSDEKQINAWAKMWRIVSDMEKIIIVLDARLDGKGKYLHSLEQSLYLTPRSRAGVAPVQKEKEKEDNLKSFD